MPPRLSQLKKMPDFKASKDRLTLNSQYSWWLEVETNA